MRFNGEISEDVDDDDNNNKEEGREESVSEAEALTKACSIGDGGLFTLTQSLVVGYALTSKKKQSFLQPKLLSLARNKGIFFIAIDRSRPLSDQGPFDVVLHKLSGKEWCQVVEATTELIFYRTSEMKTKEFLDRKQLSVENPTGFGRMSVYYLGVLMKPTEFGVVRLFFDGLFPAGCSLAAIVWAQAN